MNEIDLVGRSSEYLGVSKLLLHTPSTLFKNQTGTQRSSGYQFQSRKENHTKGPNNLKESGKSAIQIDGTATVSFDCAVQI